jgi:hypothetical protein
MTTNVPAATEIETAETSLPIFLRALAAELDGGAPQPYNVTLGGRSANMQLEKAPDLAGAAALRRWADILGCTSIRVEHNWHGNGDRYEAEGELGGYPVRVWDCCSDLPDAGETTSFLPVAELDRGFDDPPLALAAAPLEG